MIKENFSPGRGIVALLAFAPIAAAVLVVMGVAGVALGFYLNFIRVFWVAGDTGDVRMAPAQGKFRILVMVEFELFPGPG